MTILNKPECRHVDEPGRMIMVTRRFYFWSFFLCFVSGLVGYYLSPDGWEISPAIVICISVSVWVTLDSQAKGIKLTKLFALGVLLFWIIFLPAYMIESRRARGFIAIVTAMGLILVGLFFAGLGATAAYYLSPADYAYVR